MAEKMSTGLCNMMIGGVTGANSLKAIVDGQFKLFIFDGPVPAKADDALSGNRQLVVVSNGGANVNMDAAPVNGVLAKKPSETWSGNVDFSGTASFYRFQMAGDLGPQTGTAPRIQGTIGLAGADMNLGSVTLTQNSTFTVNYFVQALIPT